MEHDDGRESKSRGPHVRMQQGISSFNGLHMLRWPRNMPGALKLLTQGAWEFIESVNTQYEHHKAQANATQTRKYTN